MDYIELTDRLISVFFPPRCLICDKVVAYNDFWCGNCAGNGNLPVLSRRRLDYGFSHSFTGAIAAAQYSDGVRKLIWRLKDKADWRILRFFADEIRAAIPEYWNGIVFDIAVPVPSSRSKLKERGFNPAEMLARYVCGRSGIPVCGNALIRFEGTRAQRGLTAAERRVNAEKSYAAGKPGSVTGKTVLLVDDVLTTGSTAEACSRRLLESGACRVYVAAAASTRQDAGSCNHSETVV